MNYYELRPEENTFTNILIDLTHRCNMACANCYIPNRDIPDLDKDKLFEFLEKLPFRTYIRLIGAEPTLRDDLPEIVSTVKKIGHRPSVTTNGVRMAHLKYTQKLKKAGLRLLLHSMNGADDDEVYKIIDNGKWATLKVRALANIFKCRLPVNTGTIIAKGVNSHTIKRQIEVFSKTAKNEGINFDSTPPYSRITPVLRMKSIGLIGRHMGEDKCYSMFELAELCEQQLGIKMDFILNQKVSAGVVKAGNYGDGLTSVMFPVHTDAGKIYVRLVDWSVNDDGVVDHDNPFRGRLTQNWTVAPFFEHVKKNEFEY
jgi:molybdenum cofactor biosynthesis enzyme MoaA